VFEQREDVDLCARQCDEVERVWRRESDSSEDGENENRLLSVVSLSDNPVNGQQSIA
jgi:hypothetical protein